MANQTTLRHAGNNFARPEGVLGSIGELGNDIVDLAALQAKLTVIDTKEALGRAVLPATTLVAAVVVAITALPVVFLGLGFALAAATGLATWGALLIVGLGLAAIGGVVAYLATMRTLSSLESFRRSNEELTRNLSWLKTLLAQSTRASG